ncbi:calmin [Hoplias malabaricus]|uniref:calmin n=1 Tax=Hoplias malabaricus TaxID=27720 RepID=UPI0034617D0D
MAGHEWEDWFEREEFIGQISDIRVQNLQVEREVVQKRTFTRWMNLHLEKCNPPLEVHDLFRDIQDGRILMALLEELSGCRLLHAFKASSHRIFRLNNIAKVLTFLEERNVKLVSIDAADIADGNSSIVLGLIWNIILFFQIKELTGNIRNQFPSSSSLSSIPTSSDSDASHSSTPSDERRPSIAARDHGKAIKTLLQWVQRRTRKYGVAVQDFGKSWASGLAFLAVIKSIDHSLVDMRRALLRSSRENIEEAFRTAHYSLGIPRLLEPEDVTLDPPDEQSIMTYVSQFLEHFPGIEEDDPSDFLERSKVSARMNETPVRNGVQRKREKSYLVKRDWVQPPPKIFISSVIEEQAQTLSPVQPRTPEDRPRASEESSEVSSPSTADTRPLCRPLGLNKDNTNKESTSISPQSSQIDSAMDSPDSWGEMPSEMAPQLQQSCSEGSLSDLRYSTSPGDLTSDQGSPLLPEGVAQDQVDADLFTDEGNFSLSSLDSFQAKSMLPSEEEDAYRYILDLKEDSSAHHVPSEDIANDPDAQQKETGTVQNPETVKPAFRDHSYGDSDSGYYPGNKDTTVTEPDDVSKSSLLTDVDEQVSGLENPLESQLPQRKESLESSNAESNPVALFEDDTECPVLKYERISISGSDEDVEVEEMLSEEMQKNYMADVFSSDMRSHEECEEEPVRLREAETLDQVIHFESALEPEDENHQTEEEEADQVCSGLEISHISTYSGLSGAIETEAEIQEEEEALGSEDSGKCEEPVMKDLREANSQAASSLAEISFTEATEVEEEKLESSVLIQSSEAEEGVAYDEESDQISGQEAAIDDSSLDGSTSFLEKESSETQSLCENAAISDEKKLEGLQSETEKLKDFGAPCNQHDDESMVKDQQFNSAKEEETLFSQHPDEDESTLGAYQDEMGSVNQGESTLHHPYNNESKLEPQQNDSEDTELDNSPSEGLPESEIPQNEVLRSNISESLKEPGSEAAICEESEHSFSPPSPSSPASQPDCDQGAVNQLFDGQGQGQTTWKETERIMGTSERVERYPAELRLSLSVTPLQPAPHTDSERDAQEKGLESPEQSPFELWSRHPGEWGAVDSDLHTDHCELISSDEELSVSSVATTTTTTTPTSTTTTDTTTAARENTESQREEAAGDGTEDEKQLPSALCSTEAHDPKESKTMENVETTEVIVTNERKEKGSTETAESSGEVTLSEIYLLLLLWLLVYCFFILPQIDIWNIPSALFNMDK